MNYIHLRPLIYKEKERLEDFGVYEENSINAELYENLKKTESLNPKYEGVFPEILRLFNDAYFYLTIIFMKERPLDIYPDISYDIMYNGRMDKDFEYFGNDEECEIIVQAMLYTLLSSFGNDLTLPQKELLRALYSDLSNYDNCKKTKRVIKNLFNCANSKNKYTIPKELYTPCNIQDVLYYGTSLSKVLYSGSDIRNILDIVCNSQEQRLQIIEQLLEFEKNGFRIDVKHISEAYHCLHELKSELTGEPMPVEFIKISNIQNSQSSKNDVNKKSMGELEKEVNKLKKENEELKKKLQELLESDEGNDEDEEDDDELEDDSEYYEEDDEEEDEENYEEDDEAPKIFDSRINENAVIKKMKTLDSEKVPGMRRWYVFYRVFDFLEWLDKSTHPKYITWVQYHFGWRWKKRDFKGVPSKLKKKPSEWRKIVHITKSGKKNKNIGPDYYAFADDIVKAFVEIDDKGMHDKEAFLIDKNRAIKHHNEW